MDDYRNMPTIKFLAVKFCADVFLALRCPSIQLCCKHCVRAWIDQTFYFLKLTSRLMKWTVCEKWKRNSEKFQLLIKSFLMVENKVFSELRMFWSKLCKSNWNSAWNLAFPVFILPVVWNMSEKLHCESVYFKELHNDQEYYWSTTYRAGVACDQALRGAVNSTSNSPVAPFRLSYQISPNQREAETRANVNKH